MPTAVQMAEEVEGRVGRSALLFESLPKNKEQAA